MPGSFDDIVALTDALFRAEQARLRDVTEAEARLRRAIADLEDHRRKTMAMDNADLHGVRQIGADILWQGWIGRNKQALNIELAQVLARKAQLLRGLRKSFGRQMAAASLRDNAISEELNNTSKQQSDRALSLMLLKEFEGSTARGHA